MAKDPGPTIFEAQAESQEAPAPTLALWARSDQTDALRAACADARVRVIAAGSPQATEATLVAGAFDAHPIDDPRALAADAATDALLIADPRPWADAPDSAHAAGFVAAAARGVRLATLEPIASNTADLFQAGWLTEASGAAAADRLPMLPRFARTAHARAMADLFTEFGGAAGVRSAHFVWTGPTSIASLGARTLLAFDLIHTLLDEPESLAASYTAAPSAAAPRKAARPNLVGLAGELHVDAHLSGGRTVSCLLSDQDRHGSWSLRLFGNAGVLTLEDTRIEWADPGGAHVEQLVVDEAPGDLKRVAAALRAHLDPRTPQVAPMDTLACYAAAETALLSARTGERERPETVKRLAGKG